MGLREKAPERRASGRIMIRRNRHATFTILDYFIFLLLPIHFFGSHLDLPLFYGYTYVRLSCGPPREYSALKL